MKLSNKQLAEIQRITQEVYPNEAVMGITARGVKQLENIHPDPLNHFQVSATEFYKHNFIALVHSHTNYPGKQTEINLTYTDIRTPSKLDLITQQQLNIPSGIIGYDGENFTDVLFFPDLESDIMGQPFIYGVYDCFRVVRAWYWQNRQIKLDDWPRDFEAAEIGDLIQGKYREQGFEVLPSYQTPQAGDVAIFRIASEHENHVGIVTEPGRVLHHLSNRMPVVDNISKWAGRITRYMRYQNAENN